MMPSGLQLAVQQNAFNLLRQCIDGIVLELITSNSCRTCCNCAPGGKADTH